MKTIEIGDGSKVVDVPSHWHVEAEDDGAVLAHMPQQDFVNVRISVITLATKDPQRRNTAGFSLVRKDAKEKGYPCRLVGDKCVFSYEQDSEEDGDELRLKFWHVGYRNSIIIMSTSTIKRMAGRPEVGPFIVECDRLVTTIRSIETPAGGDAEGRAAQP